MDMMRLIARPSALPAVDDLIAVERPDVPMHCLRPGVIADAAAAFVGGFPGTVLYAVKCNPDPAVLRAVWQGGVRHFDCASAPEVALIREMFPAAAIHFMHPVKARPALRAAWQAGVRDCVLDCAGELEKIVEETPPADRGLLVRLALPRGGAAYDLSGKFGAPVEEAAALLRAARPHAARLGVCFHVGSQCLDPAAWRRAMALAGEAIRAAGVAVEVVDVGGGFPVAYPGSIPPALGDFFGAIADAFGGLGLPAGTQLWAEPGRALAARGTSVVARVLLRRGDELFINDGIYGSLSDAGAPGFRFPARLARPDGPVPSALVREFTVFGPTCDAADRLSRPVALPEDVAEGDWIEFGQLGAYGACLSTGFNGFDAARTVAVRDPAMM